MTPLGNLSAKFITSELLTPVKARHFGSSSGQLFKHSPQLGFTPPNNSQRRIALLSGLRERSASDSNLFGTSGFRRPCLTSTPSSSFLIDSFSDLSEIKDDANCQGDESVFISHSTLGQKHPVVVKLFDNNQKRSSRESTPLIEVTPCSGGESNHSGSHHWTTPDSLTNQTQENHKSGSGKNSSANSSSSSDSPNLISLNSPARSEMVRNGERKGKVIGRGSFGYVMAGIYRGKKVAAKVQSSSTKERSPFGSRCTNGENIPQEQTNQEDECSCVSFGPRELLTMQLKHPNLIRLIGVTFDPSSSSSGLVMMDYGGKTNLQKMLDDSDVKLSTKRKISFGCQISSALKYCHSKGILHLDVKPSNVLVHKKLKCRLADFGSCKMASSKMCTKHFNEGTLIYKAPELFQRQVPSEKCDVFSFGITLWQIISRKIPYLGLDQHCIIYKVVSQNLRPDMHTDWSTPPSSVSSELIEQVCANWTKCWQANHIDRPTMSQVHAELKALLK